MNILILTDRYPPDVGGLAVSTRRLAIGLAGIGHTVWVSVLVAGAAPGTSTTSDDGGVSVLRVGAHRRTDDALADWFDQIVALHTAHPLGPDPRHVHHSPGVRGCVRRPVPGMPGGDQRAGQ